MLIVFKVFVNRNDELNFLDSAYRSDRSEFIVIYGRRRIGKTELLREFIKDKNAVYFLADERSDQDNLSDFRTLVAGGIDSELLSASNLDWGDTLKEVSKNEKRLIIVIDEYPYLISGNKSIPSIFQKAWDLYLNDSNVMLILCGSSISMMEQYVLGSKSPLYGRRSGQIRVEPLKFKHTASFFPELMAEDLVKIYGITDGIPYYLKEARYRIKKISDLESIYSVEGLLIEEAEILLKYEFREPAKYFSILKALAFGNTKFGDIVNATGLSSSIISQYLSNLIILNIVKAQYPVTDMNQRSRNARYYITDNYFTFWFRFVYPNKSLIYNNLLIPDFGSDFNRYLGHVFEKISAEFLWEVRPFGFTQMGRWWHKDVEIDLVAFNEKTKEMMFIECKWSSLSMGDCLRVLNKLKEKSMAIKWNPGGRKEYLGIIAKRIERKDALREKGFLVFDLDDFVLK
ncbi:MAG: ATP-binding protein [Methanosarcinales archaeon]|nr:ATP-binding protein [Methanosarcinales archaeon]